MSKTIQFKTCEVTGKVNLRFIKGNKCFHNAQFENKVLAKNYIARYKRTGKFILSKSVVKVSETQVSVPLQVPPMKFQSFHRRYQSPISVAQRQFVVFNGKRDILLIFKDAAGKVFRVLQSLIIKYFTDRLTKIEFA